MARRTFGADDYHFLSYPGSGRNWMTLMIGRMLNSVFDLGITKPQKFLARDGFRMGKGSPRVWFSHDDRPHVETLAQIRRDKKNRFAGCNVVLIVRDPRDAVVSGYHKHRYVPRFSYGSVKRYFGPLHEYLRHEKHGIEGAVAWLNVWADRRDVPAGFLLVRYEDMKQDVVRELRRVCEFMGVKCGEDVLREATEFASFDNVRAMERAKQISTGYVVEDDRSLLTREGKIGGHREHLSPADLVYAAEAVAELDPMYGYEAEAW